MPRVLWSSLEEKIALSELPLFHRAFLKQHRPELKPEELPLRRVQQYVSQTLFTLVKQGKAKQNEDTFSVELDAIPPEYQGLVTS